MTNNQGNEPMSQYYLYRHVRLDTNQPFYIGIGKKYSPDSKLITREYKRAYYTILKDARSDLWHRVYEKCKHNIEIEIMLESDSRDEMIQKEIEFIKLYGRIKDGGTLVNHTNGGDGQCGFIKSQETRDKLSKANLGKKLTEDHKEKLRKAKWGKHQTPEHIENSRKANLGRKFPKEVRDKISNTLMGHSHSEETKEKIRIKIKALDPLRERDKKGHFKKTKK